MGQRQAAFGHHLHQVSQAQLEAKIPAHAQDDDLAVEVATLEQLLDAHQPAHAHPSGTSADIIAGQILPFAPEPLADPPPYSRLPRPAPRRRLPRRTNAVPPDLPGSLPVPKDSKRSHEYAGLCRSCLSPIVAPAPSPHRFWFQRTPAPKFHASRGVPFTPAASARLCRPAAAAERFDDQSAPVFF